VPCVQFKLNACVSCAQQWQSKNLLSGSAYGFVLITAAMATSSLLGVCQQHLNGMQAISTPVSYDDSMPTLWDSEMSWDVSQ